MMKKGRLPVVWKLQYLRYCSFRPNLSLSISCQVKKKTIVYHFRHHAALLLWAFLKLHLDCDDVWLTLRFSRVNGWNALHSFIWTAYLCGLWLLWSLCLVTMEEYWFNSQGLWSYPWQFTYCYDNKTSLGSQWVIISFGPRRNEKVFLEWCADILTPIKLPTPLLGKSETIM